LVTVLRAVNVAAQDMERKVGNTLNVVSTHRRLSGCNAYSAHISRSITRKIHNFYKYKHLSRDANG